jgi:hypothetical protein
MDFYISMAVAVVLQALKDKTQKAKVRPAMFKIFRTIGETYKDDETFTKWAKFYGEGAETE